MHTWKIVLLQHVPSQCLTLLLFSEKGTCVRQSGWEMGVGVGVEVGMGTFRDKKCF